jgi:amidase
MSNWKSLASAKRDSILASIPEKWHIAADKLPSNKDQRDVTKYVQKFLTEKEIEITETDVVGIVEKTTSGTWSAVEVTEAFCHRASLAHQLVSIAYIWPMTSLLTFRIDKLPARDILLRRSRRRKSPG